MTGLFDQIKLLFEQQLYTNVVSLVSFDLVSWAVNQVTLHFEFLGTESNLFMS
jgi:hypothetical protein